MDTLKLSRYNRRNKGCVCIEKYNCEFKSMIVELYKTGRKVLDLSREYGVSEVTIYKWGPLTSRDDTDITLEEIKCMKQEMLRLQEEHEILKKAMTTFPSSWG